MYVVAGATGRVGSATARHLLDAGARVRVLTRRQAGADAWTRQGADARVVDLSDRTGLADALAGCTGFFTLLPFDLAVPGPVEPARSIAAATSGAVTDAEVPHVVVLSSGGADLPAETGPITGLHHLEGSLRATGSVVTALRSGHFQEKVSDVVGVARAEGIYPVFAASADVPRPMGATRDVGAVAARALLSPPARSEVVDVLGPHYTEREVAGVLGAALGRALDVVTLPEPAWVEALSQTGLPLSAAESLAELYRADDRGLLDPRGDRTVRVGTPIGSTVAALLGAAPAVRT